METNNHTPEPWRKEGGQLIGSDGSPVVAAALGIGLGADNGDGNRAANSRRIVACVNACAGIPTETLESGEARSVRNELADIATLERHRDRLLAALCLALPFVEDHRGSDAYKPGVVSTAEKTIRDAIAAVEQPSACAHSKPIMQHTGDGAPVEFCPDAGRLLQEECEKNDRLNTENAALNDYCAKVEHQRDQLLQALRDCVLVMERDLNGLKVIQPELNNARSAIAAVEQQCNPAA